MNLMKPECESKRIDLLLDCPPELSSLVVKGDEGRLHQIMTNLVGNAIKFTEEGSVTIKCRLVEKDKKMGLNVCVQDTGPGIE